MMKERLGRLEEDRKEAVRARAREDFYYFCEYVLGYRWMHRPWHSQITEWAEQVKGPYRGEAGDYGWTGLLAPRGHGKTTLLTAGHCLWSLVRAGAEYPLSCGIAHALRDQALKILGDIRWHFEMNERLKWLFPEICYREPAKESPVWREKEISVKRERYYRVPSVSAFALEASKVGLHFDILYLDDLVIDVTTASPATREQVRQFFAGVPPLLRADGWRRVMVAGTRWDVEDQYAEMLDPDKGWRGVIRWRVLSVRKEDGSPVWPTVFTKEQLDMMEQQDPWMFSCVMMNNPLPTGMMTFNTEDVVRYDLEWSEEKQRWDVPWEVKENGPLAYYTAVDPNVKTGEGGDAGVVTTVAKDTDQNLWVVSLSRGHPSPSELIDWVRSHVQQYQPEEVFFEVVASQETFLHWFQQDSVKTGVSYPIRDVRRAPGQSKTARILTLGPLVKQGKLKVPRGETFEPILRELRSHSRHRKKNVDDCLDTLADIMMLGSPPDPERAVVLPPHDPWLLGRLVNPGGGLYEFGVSESVGGCDYGSRARASGVPGSGGTGDHGLGARQARVVPPTD